MTESVSLFLARTLFFFIMNTIKLLDIYYFDNDDRIYQINNIKKTIEMYKRDGLKQLNITEYKDAFNCCFASSSGIKWNTALPEYVSVKVFLNSLFFKHIENGISGYIKI